MFETLISALVDTWPATLRKRKVALTGVFCAAMFLVGIPFVTQGGMYLLQVCGLLFRWCDFELVPMSGHH